MEPQNEPPLALQRLAESVRERLSGLGMAHTTRFVPPTEPNNWRLFVATEDAEEGYIFGAHGSDTIGVIPGDQEDVSVALATEYVLMSLDLITEAEWWEICRVEKRGERELHRAARRASITNWSRGGAVSQIPWVPDYARARTYLLALACWFPLTAATFFLLLERTPWVLVPGALAFAAHMVFVDMLTSAAIDQRRSTTGLWALRAQLWLLAGGALRQAWRAR